MGVELTKNMRSQTTRQRTDAEYHIENVIIDGDTTTSHIHDNVSKQIRI